MNSSILRARTRHECIAFTLIELLVVIAIIAILAAMLLLGLSKAKARTERLQCMSQMKQIGVAIQIFVNDHDDKYPPSAYRTGSFRFQLSWDDYIHRDIGGTDSDADLELGITSLDKVPKILKCPADRNQVSINWGSFAARRSYAMNFAGFEVGKNGPLPEAKFGVGIYIVNNDGSPPEWDRGGYRASVVQDNAGTILLCELPDGRNMAGNDMPSFCAGPVNSEANFPGLMPDCFQMSLSSFSYGALVYRSHGYRFNYLFHDGHISTLKYADTVGTGTEKAPRGMWTMITGD